MFPGAAGTFPLPAAVELEELPSRGCDPHHNRRLPVCYSPPGFAKKKAARIGRLKFGG
jgi:hypothetical protein